MGAAARARTPPRESRALRLLFAAGFRTLLMVLSLSSEYGAAEPQYPERFRHIYPDPILFFRFYLMNAALTPNTPLTNIARAIKPETTEAISSPFPHFLYLLWAISEIPKLCEKPKRYWAK